MFAVKFVKLFAGIILHILLILGLFIFILGTSFLFFWFNHYSLSSESASNKSKPFVFSVEIPLDTPIRIGFFDLSPLTVDLKDTTVNSKKPLFINKGFILSINTDKVSLPDEQQDYWLVIPTVRGNEGEVLRTMSMSLETSAVVNIIPLISIALSLYILIVAVTTNRKVSKMSLLGTIEAINERYYSIDEWPNLIESDDPEVKWCYILAKQGDMNAQYELAIWFMNGFRNVVPVNKEASVTWLEKAALQAHPLAIQLYQAVTESNL